VGIYQRRDSWEVRAYAGVDPVAGKPHRVSRLVGGSRRKAEREEARLKVQTIRRALAARAEHPASFGSLIPSEERAVQRPGGVPMTRNVRTAYAGDQPVEDMCTPSPTRGRLIPVRYRAVSPFTGAWPGMKSPAVTAALTLSLTGRHERQGTEAADGIRLWAEAAGVLDDRR
jgi:hypothetical protein